MRSFIFLQLLPPDSASDEELLGLSYERTRGKEDEVTWLLGSYMEYVIREAVELGRRVGAAELRAHLRQKFETHKMKRLSPLNFPGNL